MAHVNNPEYYKMVHRHLLHVSEEVELDAESLALSESLVSSEILFGLMLLRFNETSANRSMEDVILLTEYLRLCNEMSIILN